MSFPAKPALTVPQYVAMNYMMNYGYDHGIFPENTEFQIPNDTIHINGYIDLATLCNNASIDFEVLKKLNPQITKTVLPDQTRDFVLKVPSVRFTYLMSNRASHQWIPAQENIFLPVYWWPKPTAPRTDSLGGNGLIPLRARVEHAECIGRRKL